MLAALVACASSAPQLVAADRAAALPALEYRLAAGGTWSSQPALGRVIVIDVWATYCEPCKKAFPKLDRLAAMYPDVDVVGISVDEEDASVEAFLRETPAAFAIARDPEATVQSGPLGIRVLPTVLVVDRRGRIRLRAEKMKVEDYDRLAGIVAQLRGEP